MICYMSFVRITCCGRIFFSCVRTFWPCRHGRKILEGVGNTEYDEVCVMCGAKWLYTGFLVICSLRVLKSETRTWTVNFSSVFGIGNCGLFRLIRCGSVFLYPLRSRSVRNRFRSVHRPHWLWLSLTLTDSLREFWKYRSLNCLLPGFETVPLFPNVRGFFGNIFQFFVLA